MAPVDRLLLLPFALAVAVLRTGNVLAKMGVPLSCALVLLWRLRATLRHRPDPLLVVAAFGLSAAGDWFLSNRGGRESFFLAGIALFFCAHLGYIGYAWRRGGPSIRPLGILLILYLPYYAFWLRPSIPGSVLSLAVLLYLLVSCLALSVAWGMELLSRAKWPYVAGIGLIVVSDTIISLHEFLRYRGLSRLILPTYYLAHLCVTWSVLRAGANGAQGAGESG